MDKERLLASGAYRLFLEELDKHLGFADQTLSGASWGTAPRPLTQAERTSLSAAFHTIRGGAGFFALADLAATAKSLEEQLALPLPPNSDDTESARALVAKLQQLATQLPRP